MPDTQGQTGRVLAAPSLPRVNLMPPEIAEAARFRRFQLAMGATVLAAVAIVGALYVHAQSSVADAQSDLDAAKAEGTNLSTQISSLSSVQDVYTRVAARQAMLTTAMGHEIRWSYYLTDLSLKVPDNVWLTDMHATQSSTGLGAPGVPVPAVGAAPTSVASIEFQGVAFKHVDVATWLDALAKERGFTNPYFTNSAEAFIGPKKTVSFDSSVDMTAESESGRYTKPAGS